MVINVGALKSGDHDLVARDIRGVVEVAHEVGYICKVIIETSLLSDDEKVSACLIAKEAGADFVKTSTGFSTGGATAADVALMRRVVGGQMGVKASGGVRDLKQAQEMIRAGATRIGASVGVKIIQEVAGNPIESGRSSSSGY
jgi:deoxyribose-phosphate aldolase